MAERGGQSAHGTCDAADSLRANARPSRFPARGATQVCGLRSLGYAGQLEIFRSSRSAARPRAASWLVWPNEQNQICCCSQRANSPPVKNYILDTNVLLHDPNSLLSFE